jgi:D-ribose pyranose/furanose isomerase RbsD
MLILCPQNQWPAPVFHENVDLALSQGMPSLDLTLDELRVLYLSMWLELISPAGNA